MREHAWDTQDADKAREDQGANETSAPADPAR